MAAKTCDICDRPIRWNNTIGVCRRKPTCGREYSRRWMATHYVKVEKRPCEMCGEPIGPGNKTGACVRKSACRQENKRRWYLAVKAAAKLKRLKAAPPCGFFWWNSDRAIG